MGRKEEKINKNDSSLAKLIRKKGKETQITIIRNERNNITIVNNITTLLHRLKGRVIKQYYEHLCL